MEVTKFRLYYSDIEIGSYLEPVDGKWVKCLEYKPYITQMKNGGNDMELIAEFDNADEALTTLDNEKYVPHKSGNHYCEYFVSEEVFEVDEDGDMEFLYSNGDWCWNSHHLYEYKEDKNHNIIVTRK